MVGKIISHHKVLEKIGARVRLGCRKCDYFPRLSASRRVQCWRLNRYTTPKRL